MIGCATYCTEILVHAEKKEIEIIVVIGTLNE